MSSSMHAQNVSLSRTLQHKIAARQNHHQGIFLLVGPFDGGLSPISGRSLPESEDGTPGRMLEDW
jgi:hypothetical protein